MAASVAIFVFMITLEFDEHGNVVMPAKPKSQSFHYKEVKSQKLKVESDGTLNFQLSTLKTEHANLLLQRNRLSTSIAPLVESIRVKLLKERPELAAAFMRGEVAMPELKDLRAKIDSVQAELTEVWDKIQHVETYGKLPEAKLPEQDSADIKAIKHDIRRLNDLIGKTNKKLEGAKGKVKTTRMLDWIEKKSLAEATREELKHKLKRLEYEQRTAAS